MTNPHLYSRILIVDDEAEVCEALKDYLTAQQFVVETASDGEDALAKLDDFDPYCILLDIRMPYLNGKEALKMIKLRSPDVEVIMVTAVANLNTAEECMQNGAFGFLAKPVDLSHLLKDINKALEHRKNKICSKENDGKA
ncbi:MAG: response regulator [Nitrospina sp.]|jgi:DNA-binding NtrC family response regulator|nr:response regulator [Nitrospina sp.]